MYKPFIVAILLVFFVVKIDSVEVAISIKDDSRVDYELDIKYHKLFKHSEIKLSISNFRLEHGKENSVIGFSMTKTDDRIERKFNSSDGCFLQESNLIESNISMAFFIMDFKNNQVQIDCSSSWTNYRILEDESMDLSFEGTETNVKPLKMSKIKSDDKYSYYSFKFYISAAKITDEGMYKLFFHNCKGDKLSYDVVYNSEHHYDFLQARYSLFPFATCIIVSCSFFMLGLYWVYVYRTSQHALQKFHFVSTFIIFLLGFLNALYSIKLQIIDFPGERRRNWITFMSLFYLTHFVILCGMLTLGVQGWNFVKSIFGRKEKRCLMGVLIVQAIMLSLEYYQDFFPIGIAYHDIFLFAAMTDFVSVVVMIIYLFIRKAGTRSHKAAENLRKYQLFRFVYIMIVICFYLVGIIVSILRFNYIIPAIKYVYQVYEDVDMFLFFAVMSYKFQPKLLSEILAMGNEVEVLPINDINKELNNLDDE